MCGRVLVLPEPHLLHDLQERQRELFLVLDTDALGKACIFLLKRLSVRGNHLHRKDGLPGTLGPGILLPHDIVAVFHQVRCHHHGKKPALPQGFLDGAVEVLAGHKELVVPDGDVPAEVVLVDEPHKLLGIGPVFLAVAQEHIGIEGRPDLLGQLVPHQHRGQEPVQLLLIPDGGGISIRHI